HLAVKLLRQIRKGDTSEYGELYNQVCHQFTVDQLEYVVVPHLVDIAKQSSRRERVEPLSIVGTVAAARMTYASSAAALTADVQEEYLRANEEAMALTADALSHGPWEPNECLQLIATLAALHGRANLAIFLVGQGDADKLSCPECGEYIEFREGE